ncbi:MAG: rRNA pseudouridine synthase [Oscillospiraceae bacterium]|nr:rRNA pseudouridine synthase [Oscillospiraceae bacterium]
MDNKIRLQKFLSDAGVASRRKAEELIAAGDVKVNGRTAAIGDKIDPRKDLVSVKGKKVLRAKGKYVYLMLHKPRGYVTTMSDERGRRCVAELVADAEARVYPVGRLDRESEGLLLFTNDGEFANAMTHPSKHVSKTYRVTVRPGISDEQLTRLTEGMMLDGRKTMPAEVRVLLQEEGRVVLEIVLFEGRNRQIRKMLEEVGLETARLKRVAVGSLKLGMLEAGKWRRLTDDEVKYLKRAAGQARAE